MSTSKSKTYVEKANVKFAALVRVDPCMALANKRLLMNSMNTITFFTFSTTVYHVSESLSYLQSFS